MNAPATQATSTMEAATVLVCSSRFEDFFNSSKDEPGCATDPCIDLYNECIDALPPQLGHTCNCSMDNGFYLAANMSTCLGLFATLNSVFSIRAVFGLMFFADFDYCTTLPCDPNADCTDDAVPAVTRTCTCRTGYLKNVTDESCYLEPTGLMMGCSLQMLMYRQI
jgi:hypothetical protein